MHVPSSHVLYTHHKDSLLKVGPDHPQCFRSLDTQMHRFQFCAGEVGSIVGAFVCTRTDAELRKELEGLEERRIWFSVQKVKFRTRCAHTIYMRLVYLSTIGCFLIVNSGKYTSPMDA